MGGAPPPQPAVDWLAHEAVLFDLDGVITPTAAVHQRAWAELFADRGYDEADYLAHIDGKPRYDGVSAFLASRSIELPWGDPNDGPEADTVCGLGNRKNRLFNEILDREPLAPYPGTVAVLDLLDANDVATAVVSSSRNARRVLAAAGLGDHFPVVVDGVTASDEGLAGKPDPHMFLVAADRLGVQRDRVIVVEDAVAGVRAGVAGSFAVVVGVDRGGNRRALIEAGATLVVDDLAETLEHSPTATRPPGRS